MALLPILKYPNERLHIVAQPVKEIDERIKKLTQDMAETMYEARGIGLAATQVDVHERVVVIDLSEERNDLLVLINPVITHSEGTTTYEEGCLSIPSIYDKVQRAERVRIEYQDINGANQTLDADGLLAICIQHEIDHLNGKLFIEYLSPMKQNRIKTKMKKREREEAKQQ
ncbi:peptide deformylase [Alysiella filiformis]|uniref:Peptide deformylase n=1 Tax=Alysiella filiformis DSM 16848 TaxID=1120981 RepID=A0A286E7D2_9NEIS|nr:peptide deformylase [Alysiella filiformis]QMT31584.1 peptide deformylase [Alysiella filiformis]UBQ55404.1 peptide deformylase [Alysiella filiformis DSM 16848]SOD66764.1 peptide deformylase [Alysiella filiformis DSM 16848]